MANVYGPLKLPKSGKAIKFREPLGSDRLEVLKNNPIGTDDVVSASQLTDLYLAAKCVTEIDGNAVQTADYKHLFDSWPNADVEYYRQVYSKMFTVSNDTMDAIDSVADFLLKGSGSAASSTSMTTATAHSAGTSGTE